VLTPQVPIVTLNNGILSSTAATNYQWFLNGTLILNATNQTYIPTKSGKYSVRTSDQNGCVSKSIEYEFVISATTDLEAASYQIFPNPTHDILNINTSLSNTCTLYNTNGALLKSFSTKANESYLLDVSTLPKGIYMLVFKQEGKGSSRVFVVE
jgi:Secretion system C-terminal sorting domain